MMVDVNPSFSALGVMERDEVSVRGLLGMGMTATPFSRSDFSVVVAAASAAAAGGVGESSTARLGAISKL